MSVHEPASRTTAVAEPDGLEALLSSLRQHRELYRQRHGAKHAQFLAEVERDYERELRAFTGHCERDSVLRSSLRPTVDELTRYLRWLRWALSNAACLVVVPGTPRRPSALARALLVYAACRLIDDGLDGHLTYKNQHATLVLGLRRAGHSLATARAQSVFWGGYLVHYALGRCEPDVAALFDEVALGALAEAVLGPDCDLLTYQRMVARKTVAYGLLLYRPMLADANAATRRALVAALVDLEGLGQLVNDYLDEADDRVRGQPNAIAAGFISRGDFPLELRTRLDGLAAGIQGLDDDVRLAIDAMAANVTDPLGREAADASSSHGRAAAAGFLGADSLVALLEGRTGASVPQDSLAHERIAGLPKLVLGLHRQNFFQWEREAQSRRRDLNAVELAAIKRLIDESNRVRTALTNEIDAIARGSFGSREDWSDAHLNSESIGQLIDRLSILTLKLHFNRVAAEREDLSAGRRAAANAALLMLRRQRAYVVACYDRLLNELAHGLAALPPAHQIKLYEDADLDA